MADIVIRGMKMPKYCSGCPLQKDNLYTGHPLCMPRLEPIHVNFSTGRDDFCPLVPIPEGHGRLGDLDKLEDAFIRYYLSQERSNHLVFTPVEIKQHFADMIGDWPTIVPAEGGGMDG